MTNHPPTRGNPCMGERPARPCRGPSARADSGLSRAGLRRHAPQAAHGLLPRLDGQAAGPADHAAPGGAPATLHAALERDSCCARPVLRCPGTACSKAGWLASSAVGTLPPATATPCARLSQQACHSWPRSVHVHEAPTARVPQGLIAAGQLCPQPRVMVTGHSLGGALAILAAFDIQRRLQLTNVQARPLCVAPEQGLAPWLLSAAACALPVAASSCRRRMDTALGQLVSCAGRPGWLAVLLPCGHG